jgi:hypothetical protein
MASDHDACVAAWMRRIGELPPRELLQAMQLGFGAVWIRAHRTLGVVTLVAVGRRVLARASESIPLLGSLKVDADGLHCDELDARAEALDASGLRAGVQLVLVDFLTILGRLTSEVLASDLHAELDKVGHRAGSTPESAATTSPRGSGPS